ncbi:Uncharacterized protein QTN25_006451 [Entamoeba marina]
MYPLNQHPPYTEREYEDLNHLLKYYSDPDYTPFKCEIVVKNNDREKRFVEKYLKECLPQQSNNTTGVSTPGMNNFSLTGGSSLMGGTSLMGGSSLTGGSSLSIGGTSMGNQPTQTNAAIQSYSEDNKSFTMKLCFFQGLEMRADFQEEREQEIQKEIEEMKKTLQDVMKYIQEDVQKKCKELAKKSFELDKEIIRVIRMYGIPDDVIGERFKDVKKKVVASGLENKIGQLEKIIESNQSTEQTTTSLDEKTKESIVTMIQDEQKAVMRLGQRIIELQTKYERVKETLQSMKETRHFF